MTRAALVDRLSAPHAWPSETTARQARRFFRYLDHWRLQTYTARLLAMQQDYDPFNPDNDLLTTRAFSPADREHMKGRILESARYILKHANYTFVEPAEITSLLTRESHYGLDLKVDLDAFEDLIVAYRGATHETAERRRLLKFLRKEEFPVPIFRRLFILFKLKPDERRISELCAGGRMSRKKATRLVERSRRRMSRAITDDNIYMKLFKNLPRSDLEMVFPNTEIRFRALDKLKLGVTSGGALGMGAFGAAGKMALLFSSPFAAGGALLGLGGIAFRQAMNFSNQRQKYMVVMAQNLYFHSMADNRSVLNKLAERAAEEDVKEEFLLYSILCKEPARREDLPSIDRAIEHFLEEKFGVNVDFDVTEALERLMADGIVTETADGVLVTRQPDAAANEIDRHWDRFLDLLPDPVSHDGHEMTASTPGPG